RTTTTGSAWCSSMARLLLLGCSGVSRYNRMAMRQTAREQAERRKYPRVKLNVAAVIGIGDRWMRGLLIDISRGGMQVRVMEEIPARLRGAKLRFVARKQECTAEGNVQWVARGDAGVTFTQSNPALRDFLIQLERLAQPLSGSLLQEIVEVEIELL